ncbi:hypothetical protein BYT27DRAFT_7105600 [Phlegmacium glaucopus]|nr:hypothetical protein BYT27DRAFT_7105600 [Phlegmacium glaucopus]
MWVVLPKSGSVRFFPNFGEPRVELWVQSRQPVEPWTGWLVQVQEGPVQVQYWSEPEPNI